MQFFSGHLLQFNNPMLSYPQRLRRLRLALGSFCFCLLASLAGFLLFALSQVEDNQRGEYQREANRFLEAANKSLARKRMLINAIPTDVFSYYRNIYNPVSGQINQELSPLAELNYQQPKMAPQVKGLVGFFQINAKGEFNSPVWPGLIDNPQPPATHEQNDERVQRKRIAMQLYDIIGSARSIKALLADNLADKRPLFTVIFDSPDHLIFYRIVMQAEQRLLQGYVVERGRYFSNLMIDNMEDMRFDIPVMVTVEDAVHRQQTNYYAWQNDKISTQINSQNRVTTLSEPDLRLQKLVLYTSYLAWPYDHTKITFTTDSLPMTDSAFYSWLFVLLVMLMVLLFCFGFYGLGVKQLQVAEQQLNFVSSVSHELKTPLTSIRMYSEMLKQGTVMSETHRQEYCDFIFDESERLSRLINNVLLLASFNHQQQSLPTQFTPVAVIRDLIRSKTSSMMEKNGFEPQFLMALEQPEEALIGIDHDAFSQVIINITDNAIKFFDKDKIQDPARQKIDFIFRQSSSVENEIQLEIRDYGEGISLKQEDKIFELFYRGGNELTRTTQGTGIGLALVKQLVVAQQGRIHLERQAPGLSLVLTFKSQSQPEFN